MQDFLLALAHDTELHFAALRTFQALHRFVVGHNLAHESRVVDFHNAVARHDAYLFGRTTGNDIADVNGVLLNGELHTDTAEATSQVVVHGLQVLGRDIGRVGVQFSQNLWHGIFYQFAHVHGVHILVIDDAEQAVQLVRVVADGSGFLSVP